jgi:hypothetical protein
MRTVRSVFAAAAAMAAIVLAPAAHAQTAYDLAALNPQVREAVIRARTAEARALGAAERARQAAQRGAEAAQRARNGEAGTSAHEQTWGDPQRSARYETEIVNDNRHGYGSQTYTGGPWVGDHFAGQFVEGRKHGLGVYRYAQNANNADQITYEGEWASSLQSGHGVSTWTNGDRYAGAVQDDNWNGAGVYRFADGRRIEGEFVNGRTAGLSVEWDANGQVRLQGIFSGGELTTPLAP